MPRGYMQLTISADQADVIRRALVSYRVSNCQKTRQEFDTCSQLERILESAIEFNGDPELAIWPTNTQQLLCTGGL